MSECLEMIKMPVAFDRLLSGGAIATAAELRLYAEEIKTTNMDNKLVTNMISKDAKEIESIIAEFDKYVVVPQILIDLTLSKIKNLYAEVQLLNKSDEQLYNIRSILDCADKIEKSGAEQAVFNQQESEVAEEKPVTVQLTPEMIKFKRDAHILATQLKFDNIKDIRGAIDINKKIWFNKELFAGNIDLYNKTIDVLNGMKNLKEALEYVDTNFKWDIDNKTVKDFMEFIYRRYF
jgi:hypothetical protein